MSKKTTFNRIDKIKDTTAKAEIARAHTMIALLGTIIIALLWVLYHSVDDVPAGLALLAAALLALIVLFSVGVVYSMLKLRKQKGRRTS